jgi:serine/threonine protein kinase
MPRTPAPGSGRFTPGAIIAGRYRLVALLGRGGMGEVYRADDLTLDQPVALKFLPQGVAADAPHLAQFHNELRTARQVSHKNVCRLYDLGGADGRRFLTALFQLSIIVTLTFMLVRFGLLVTAVAFTISALLEDIPMRLSVSHWTALSTNIAIALALGAAAWGFYASRAGQPVFGKWEA